jgi:NAD(P) transhydrogenase subunit alpha
MAITVGALRETAAGERRVAITPEMAKKMRGRGWRVLLERDAGASAGFPDTSYADVEFASAAEVCARADVLTCVLPPADGAIAGLREQSVLVGQLRPYGAHERIAAMSARKLAAYALELLPRTTRAQAMDVLSSQAAVAGYRAMLIAAESAPKFFPMLTTAAGTIRPSRVLVIGAGVAGLQAIATARRLGAQTEGYDVRPETREQVESLGAKFLDLGVSAAGSGGYARELSAEERAAQQQALADHLKNVDVIVSTAAVPGRPAPKILSDGGRHEARCADRGHGRRERRQLRADPSGRARGAGRRDHSRPTQPARRCAAARVGDVRAQRVQFRRAAGEGRRGGAGRCRRTGRQELRHPRRHRAVHRMSAQRVCRA